jgi:ornithine cyclodeaminase/alanine dehydrogenase-like protein (mu-crystallin family)
MRLGKTARTLLWDVASSLPTALVEEDWLYGFRTGVSAAVVAQWLWKSDAPRIAIIGAGPLAANMVEAFDALMRPAGIIIASRSGTTAEALARRLAGLETPVRAMPDTRSAVANADIVLTITTASSPILHDAWLKPGAVVISMGGDLECAFDIWERAALKLVDDLDYALFRGDFAGWIKRGETTREAIEPGIDGTVGDLANGRIQLPAGPQRIFAVVQGLTALDLAMASAILSLQPPKAQLPR